MIFDALFFRQFRRNALLSLVSLVAIALAVAVLTAVRLANAAAVDAFDAAHARIDDRIDLQVVGSGNAFSETGIARIARIPGVTSLQPVTEDALTIVAPGGALVVRAVGVDALARLPGDAELRVSRPGPFDATGSDPRIAAVLSGGAIVSAALADRVHRAVGETMIARIGGRAIAIRIAGVLAPARTGVDSSTVFFDLSRAQTLFDKRGRLDRIDLRVADALRPRVLATLRAVVPRGAAAINALDRTAAVGALRDAFASDVDALAAIAFLVSMLLVANASAIGVVQRRPEIGTFRALGADRTQIFRAFLGEGAIFGAFGSLFGIILGTWFAGGAARALGVASAAPADPGILATCWIAGVALAIVAGLVPALSAARTEPAQAMRSTGLERAGRGLERPLAIAGALLGAVDLVLLVRPSAVAGATAALVFLLAAACFVPFAIGQVASGFGRLATDRSPAVRLAAANLGHAPARLGIAVGALVIAIALSASVAVVVTSFQATMRDWATATLRSDIVVTTPILSGLPPTVIAKVRALSSVVHVDLERSRSVPYRESLVRVNAIDAGHSSSVLRVLNGRAVRANAAEVVISERTAARFGLDLGATVVLPTPHGSIDLRIVGIAADYANAGAVLTIDARTDERVFGRRNPIGMALRLRSNADPMRVRTELVHAAAPLPLRIESTGELRAAIVDLFAGTFTVASALAIVTIAIAILGVTSTLYALVAERRVEIGLLRVLGLRIAGVRSMVLYEAGMIGVLGAILGCALGVALATIVLVAVDRPLLGWSIPLHVPLTTIAFVVCAVIVAALAAGWYPARVAARLLARDTVRAE